MELMGSATYMGKAERSKSRPQSATAATEEERGRIQAFDMRHKRSLSYYTVAVPSQLSPCSRAR
jgi:hypothetical protein